VLHVQFRAWVARAGRVPARCGQARMGFDRVIRLENVSKQYGGKPVIDGLSLLIEDGELVCVTGPSGVGKSTLLHLIAGLVPPDGGVVEVSAEPIGYVFQEPRLLPWCDVRDNVQVGLYAQRLGRDERRLLVEDVLARWVWLEADTSILRN